MCVCSESFFPPGIFFPFFSPSFSDYWFTASQKGRKTYNLPDLFPKGPQGRRIKRNSGAIIILEKIIILIFLIARKPCNHNSEKTETEQDFTQTREIRVM